MAGKQNWILDPVFNIELENQNHVLGRRSGVEAFRRCPGLIPWLETLIKKNAALNITQEARSNLQNNELYRIDNQGSFADSSNLFRWINLQIQENVLRQGSNVTTFITTYVHWEGYDWGDLITSRMILRQMKWQLHHNHAESLIYVRGDVYATMKRTLGPTDIIFSTDPLKTHSIRSNAPENWKGDDWKKNPNSNASIRRARRIPKKQQKAAQKQQSQQTFVPFGYDPTTRSPIPVPIPVLPPREGTGHIEKSKNKTNQRSKSAPARYNVASDQPFVKKRRYSEDNYPKGPRIKRQEKREKKGRPPAQWFQESLRQPRGRQR